MGIEFIWSDEYSVDNAEVDGQHKYLFEIANSMDNVVAGADVKRVIMKLYRYTREHFADEETMMKEACYPELKEHAALHDGLINKLNDLAEQSLKSEQEIHKFKKFVYDWLIDHIMNHDKKYSDYAKGRAK